MKISELSITQIKALLYDSMMEKDRADHNIKMLKLELDGRDESPEDNAEEVEKTEDAV